MIEAVCIEYLGCYPNVVNEQIPRADIVQNHFHLRLSINTSFDEVGRQEWDRAKKSKKNFIKGRRYNLFANEENLDARGSAKRAALPNVNESIASAYFLKEQFRIVHTYRYPAWAKKALEQWWDMAEESGLAPCQQLARGFRNQVDQVVAYCKHRITSRLIEGGNNFVSRVIHRACDIAQLGYAGLKFRQLSIQQT